MAVEFKANNDLINYLVLLGFQPREVKSDKKYFVNKKGNQFRIDEQSGEIAILNQHGNVHSKHTSIDDKFIQQFK